MSVLANWKKYLSWELLAVVASLLYTYLLIEENPLCWYFALLGSVVYVFLTWGKKIYAESALHVFYVGMAVYGMLASSSDFSPQFEMSWLDHLGWISLGVAGMAITASILRWEGSAKLPWIDSFTTVFSLLATWLMVNFIHANWLYWIVIDTVAIGLYYKRGMKLSALLFILYLILAVKGFLTPYFS